MNEFTPGPWIAKRVADVFEINGVDDDGITTRFIAETIGGYEEEEADARLMVAAPDLLEALRAIVNNFSVGGHITRAHMHAGAAAIAKALGESS